MTEPDGRFDGIVYLEIAEAVRRSIVAGELLPGQRLPSVRDMAQRWQCTPATVARAYSRLAREGLVVSQRGGGTRVRPLRSGLGVLSRSPEWQWADLVNRAESYLLDALASGHSPAHAEAALAAAISRWQELRVAVGEDAESRGRGTRFSHLEGEEQAVVRFAGSHDLAVELLSRLLAEHSPPHSLTTVFLGSLGGLIALARGEADLAGVHLWDEKTGLYNLPFIERVLPNVPVVIVNLVKREQGILVPPGNPQGLRKLLDLAKPGVVFVNRQPGSGTRVWLDAQLKKAGLEARRIVGYQREERTHLGVARLIAEGAATAGLGIRAAAGAYGLEFVPLWEERYDLVARAEWRGEPAFAVLLKVLESTQFREALAALGGYDLSETGTVSMSD